MCWWTYARTENLKRKGGYAVAGIVYTCMSRTAVLCDPYLILRQRVLQVRSKFLQTKKNHRIRKSVFLYDFTQQEAQHFVANNTHRHCELRIVTQHQSVLSHINIVEKTVNAKCLNTKL